LCPSGIGGGGGLKRSLKTKGRGTLAGGDDVDASFVIEGDFCELRWFDVRLVKWVLKSGDFCMAGKAAVACGTSVDAEVT